MAVTIGNSGGQSGRATSISWTHVLAAGSDRYMVVTVTVENAGSISSIEIDDGGTPETFTFIRTDVAGNIDLEVWEIKEAKLGNLTDGSCTITVTPDAKRRMAAGSVGFAGVDQTTPKGTENSETGNGTTQNVTVASATDDVVVAVMGSVEQGTDAIAGGETEQANFNEANKASILLMTEAGATTVEMDTTMSSGLDWRSTGFSVQQAGGAVTYQESLPSTLRVNATQEIFLPSALKVRVIGQQKSLPSAMKVIAQYEEFLPSSLRVLATQETSLPSALKVRVEANQTSLSSILKVRVLDNQIFLPTILRVNATQETFLPSILKVRVLGQQEFLPTNLRVLLTSQLSLSSNLRVVVGAITYDVFLPSNLRVLLISQLSLPSNLRVILTSSLFLPTILRVNVTQQLSLPTTLKVRAEGQQKSLPTSLRVVVSYQEFLPTTLRVNATQELSLPTNLKVRGTELTFLPSALSVRVGFTISLPTTLKVRGTQETSLPTVLKVRVVNNQLSLSSTLRVTVSSQLSLPTNLRIIASQQSSLSTNMRVKVLANQLVKPSSLRVAVVSQISVPTSLRVKVIGNLLNLPSTLNIKVIGQQLFLPTTLRVFLQYQISLPSSLAVRASGLQLSLPSQLRIILFTGNRISLPTTMKVKAIGQQLTLPSSLKVEVPPLFTISIDDTDVGIVRKLLAQAGREVIRVHDDDILSVFYSGSSSHIYTDFQDIMDVQHIRLVDDINHDGTNYLQGSTIYDKEGKIEIGLTLPADTSEILITYATRDGLDDEVIQLNIDMAKFYLQGELWRETLDFSGSSTYEQMAKWTLYSIATYWSILGMNSSNAIQSGYNYRIAEFEIQTKLWGEGMIAETLLNKYWERSMKMINALKLFESNPEPPLYVVDRTNTKTAYNRDPTVFHTMTSMEAVKIYDSVSRYAVIMKIYG